MNGKIEDNDPVGRLEFNEIWWSDVTEGEPLTQDEIDEVRWLISEVKRLYKPQ